MTNINGEMGDKMSQAVVGPNCPHFTARVFPDDISKVRSIPLEDCEIRQDVISYGGMTELAEDYQEASVRPVSGGLMYNARTTWVWGSVGATTVYLVRPLAQETEHTMDRPRSAGASRMASTGDVLSFCRTHDSPDSEGRWLRVCCAALLATDVAAIAPTVISWGTKILGRSALVAPAGSWAAHHV